MPEPSLIAPFIRRLERLGLPYMVTGSTAGILYGEPRMTNDVDIVVALTLRDVRAFVDAFPDDEGTGFKADIYVACDELHAWGMDHRRMIVVDDLEVAVAPVEYVILRKLAYFREGRSGKHVRDILGMLDISGSDIDRSLLDGWIDRLGLRAVWGEIEAAGR